jgi:hypothetical protein
MYASLRVATGPDDLRKALSWSRMSIRYRAPGRSARSLATAGEAEQFEEQRRVPLGLH